MVVIAIAVGLIGITVLTGGATAGYKIIGNQLMISENKGELAYSKDYFKYISELEINDVYINARRSDGKWGYINQDGTVIMDFKYDFASPFVQIEAFDKKFYVAMVCEKGSTKLILKNQRKVLSYKTQSDVNDYTAQYKELEDIYKNTLKQDGDMQFESDIEAYYYYLRKPVYKEQETNYTYRYDYNEEYDLIITEGYDDNVYELAKKDNINFRKRLECDYLAYDSNYLYVYSNECIPFYNKNGRGQGWFKPDGEKDITIRGNIQIIDIVRR